MSFQDLIDLENAILKEYRRRKRRKRLHDLTKGKIMKYLILIVTIACIAAAFAISSVRGEITIPPESPRDTVIEATVKTDMPPEAEFFGDWDAPDVSSIPVGRDKLHVAGKPGSYFVTYNGYWIHFGPEITIKDVDGVEQKFRPLLGHGRVREFEPYKITGTPDPEPDPDPDPPDPTPDPEPEPGPKQIVFFIEADNLDDTSKISPAQRELVTSLQVRQDLLDLGHELIQVIDDDQIKEGVPSKWAPWIRQAIGKKLPIMAYADRTGGPIKVVPMPNGWEPMIKIIGGE